MASIEFRGKTVEYDEKCPKSYRWQKMVTRSDMRAIEDLFLGKDEEVAQLFGDDADVMQELVLTIIQDSSQQSKN